MIKNGNMNYSHLHFSYWHTESDLILGFLSPSKFVQNGVGSRDAWRVKSWRLYEGVALISFSIYFLARRLELDGAHNAGIHAWCWSAEFKVFKDFAFSLSLNNGSPTLLCKNLYRKCSLTFQTVSSQHYLCKHCSLYRSLAKWRIFTMMMMWWWCWQRWRWQICFVQRSAFYRETKKWCEGWSAMALEVLRLEKKILSFTIGKYYYQQRLNRSFTFGKCHF